MTRPGFDTTQIEFVLSTAVMTAQSFARVDPSLGSCLNREKAVLESVLQAADEHRVTMDEPIRVAMQQIAQYETIAKQLAKLPAWHDRLCERLSCEDGTERKPDDGELFALHLVSMMRMAGLRPKPVGEGMKFVIDSDGWQLTVFPVRISADQGLGESLKCVLQDARASVCVCMPALELTAVIPESGGLIRVLNDAVAIGQMQQVFDGYLQNAAQELEIDCMIVPGLFVCASLETHSVPSQRIAMCSLMRVVSSVGNDDPRYTALTRLARPFGGLMSLKPEQG